MIYKQIILEETLKVINYLIEHGISRVDTKKIRTENKISSSDRSRIMLYSLALKYLKEHEVLEEKKGSNPKRYVIKRQNLLSIEEFLKDPSFPF